MLNLWKVEEIFQILLIFTPLHSYRESRVCIKFSFFVVVSFIKDSCVYLTSAEFNLNFTAYLADLIESRFVNDKMMLILEERRARGYTYLEEIHELDSERSEDIGKASFNSNILAKINIWFNYLTNLFLHCRGSPRGFGEQGNIGEISKGTRKH